jgi:hypothetical protein
MSDQFSAPERFRAELRELLLEYAASLPARDSSPTPRPRAVRRSPIPRIAGWRLVPAIALAVAIAAVLILQSGGALAPQPATAASVLRASAAALDRVGGSRALGPGDYFYTRTAQWWRWTGYGPHPFIVRSVQEEWLARSGQGRSRYEVLGVSGVDVNRALPITRSQDVRLPRRPRPFIISSVPAILLSYTQLRRLPTDPGRLDAALNRLAASYHIARLVPQAGQRAAIRLAILRGLAEAPSSAALRAALYRVLAATPGIRLVGRTRDSIGRYGMEVSIEAQGVELEMILDPRTGQLLQTSRVLIRRTGLYPGAPAGLNYRVTFLASGIVTSIQTREP